MSWGYKILLTYVIFIGLILFMVFTASKQSNELIDDHYYEKELQYQKILDGHQNLAALPEKIQFKKNGETLQLKFPSGATAPGNVGKIEFICFSDKSKDRLFAFDPDSSGIILIPLNQLVQAQYQVRMEWENAGAKFAYRDVYQN